MRQSLAIRCLNTESIVGEFIIRNLMIEIEIESFGGRAVFRFYIIMEKYHCMRVFCADGIHDTDREMAKDDHFETLKSRRKIISMIGFLVEYTFHRSSD